MRQSRNSVAFGETETPAFTVLDLALTYRFRNTLGVSGGFRNLLDETYYEHLSRSLQRQNRAIHAPGRNAYLTLALERM